MTIGLLYHNEGLENSSFHIDYSLWDEIKATWGIDELIMVDLDNTNFLPNGRTLTYADLNSALMSNSSYDFVFLFSEENTPKGQTATFLHDFFHADNMCYVIGSNSFGLPADITIRPQDKIIKIDTARGNRANHNLWSIETMMAVVFHRWFKNKEL